MQLKNKQIENLITLIFDDMKIPFTIEQFFSVFEKYNTALYPFQWVIILLGFVALLLLQSKNSAKNKFISSYLGILWIWVGFAYHIAFFSKINSVALVFGIVFILQGALILFNTLLADRIIFYYTPKKNHYIAYFFIVFGLIIYPIIGYFLEGSFSRTISLGLPCPTTILTFGFFMMTNSKFPKYLLIIPSIWAIIGLSAAINFGVYQDFMMIISAIIANTILFRRQV